MKETIKKAYYEIRSQWAKTYQGLDIPCVPPSYKTKWDKSDGISVWEKVAEVCIDRNIDPILLIKSACKGRVEYFPWPNQLLSDTTLKNYEEMVSSQKEIATAEFISEYNAIINEYAKLRLIVPDSDKNLALKTAITSRSVLASPLCRYVVARKAGMDDVAGFFVDAAKDQYNSSRSCYEGKIKNLIDGVMGNDQSNTR